MIAPKQDPHSPCPKCGANNWNTTMDFKGGKATGTATCVQCGHVMPAEYLVKR